MPEEEPYPFHCKHCGGEIKKDEHGTWLHEETGRLPCVGLIASLDFCDAFDPEYEDEVCHCKNHE